VVPVRSPICARTPGARWRRKIGLTYLLPTSALLLLGGYTIFHAAVTTAANKAGPT